MTYRELSSVDRLARRCRATIRAMASETKKLSSLAFTVGDTGYAFRNRFDIRGGILLGIDSNRYELTPTDSAETVVLTPAFPDKKIYETNCVVLWGGAYSDFRNRITCGETMATNPFLNARTNGNGM